ncbi:hypothetical protein D3C83_80710 [compost metagenome]
MSVTIWSNIFSGFSAFEIRSLMFDFRSVERRSKMPIGQRASRKAANSRRCDARARVMLSKLAWNSS